MPLVLILSLEALLISQLSWKQMQRTVVRHSANMAAQWRQFLDSGNPHQPSPIWFCIDWVWAECFPDWYPLSSCCMMCDICMQELIIFYLSVQSWHTNEHSLLCTLTLQTSTCVPCLCFSFLFLLLLSLLLFSNWTYFIISVYHECCKFYGFGLNLQTKS